MTTATITRADAAREILTRYEAQENLLAFVQYTKPDYIISPHNQMLAAALERMERGELKRLIVVMPPQHGKSELVSLRFPCWVLGRHPTWRIVQTAYAESLAVDHSRKARDVFVSPEMQRLFPHVHHRPEREGQASIEIIRQTAHEWGTRQGGSYYGVGVGGGLTGRGMDIGIVDDPLKDDEQAQSAVYREKVWDWYRTVFRTRLSPEGAIIVVMTRWHQDDLVGKLLEQSKIDPGSDQWEVLHLPAIDQDGKALWPERYDINWLLQQRASMGGLKFTCLYQGDPVQAQGNIFKREWWRYYDALPDFEMIVASWDTAFKDRDQNDPSVGTIWGQTRNGYYLLDVWRRKVEYPELKHAVLAQYEKYKPRSVLVEDKASGQSLIQELQRETRLPVLPVKVDRDKTARANAVTPLLEAGRVFLPTHADWLYDYVEELSAFPHGKHDDQVDSTTQALSWMAAPPEVNQVIVYDAVSAMGPITPELDRW